MSVIFAPSMTEAMADAKRRATRAHCATIGPEHMLYAMLQEDADVGLFLDMAHVSRSELVDAIVADAAMLAKTIAATPPELHPSLQAALDEAVSIAGRQGHNAVMGMDMLEGLLSDKAGHCGDILRRFGITQDSVKSYNEGDFTALTQDVHSANDRPPENRQLAPVIRGGGALQTYCINLNEKARRGLVEPLIGRVREIEETVETLCQRKKSNPLYVGDPGVGKTVLAEGLAARIVKGDVPNQLRGASVFSLDMGTLVAGTQFRGDFEKRMQDIINELSAVRIEHGVAPILFIDEIHTLIGAGETAGGPLDGANMLKPILASGGIRCIGATTYDEYRQHFEKNKAMVRRFQVIDVPEPSVEETVEILRGVRGQYEDHHGIVYTDEALEAAAKLAKRHIIHQKLPDSAVTVLDRAGASFSSVNRTGTVDKQVIAETVAKIAHKPSDQLTDSDAQILRTLENKLKGAVFQQDTAIHEVATAVKLSRAGLRDEDKTVGNYVFTGPTGVGKTEVAKQLAESLGIDFLRFDMSEYMDRHASTKLIGAGPGYIGFNEGGQLTKAIDQHPHCVLLLDEIEKAHPDIFNLLLQVMDSGRLTDSNGKSVDFRNVVLIMTSNAGATVPQNRSIGFNQDQAPAVTKAATDAIDGLFTPEFRNRLDAVVPFDYLGPEAIRKVAEKFVDTLKNQLAERKVALTLDDAAYAYLSDKGYDRLMGARPMGRLIQKEIKAPLADEILFGCLQDGGTVEVTLGPEAGKDGASQGGLCFTFKRAAAPEQSESTPCQVQKQKLSSVRALALV